MNHIEIKGNVADGDFLSSILDGRDKRFYISVTFYTDSTRTTPVRPTAGTLSITASEDDFNFGTITNGDVDVTQEAYARPSVECVGIKRFKAALTGVVGAGYFVVKIIRST